MKIPYEVSEHIEEENRNYGAINLVSLLSHAQSQSKNLLCITVRLQFGFHVI